MKIYNILLALSAILLYSLGGPSTTVHGADINKQGFFLYTQYNQDSPYELKIDDILNLQNSPFDPSVPTKLSIHGWQGNYESEYQQNLKSAFLAAGPYNVILCDYRKYNAPYIYAVAEAKSVGANIGRMISYLVSSGALNPKDVHIIGHSLGAHIGGFASKSISASIVVPFVTGLDPAGPLFKNKKADDRLSGDDAEFVQCIHTSTLLGLSDLCGTADMFPNGGDNQPACDDAPIPETCSHFAAFAYYAVSIVNQTAFQALKCQTVQEATSVNTARQVCVHNGAVMGDDAVNRTPAGIYYIDVKK